MPLEFDELAELVQRVANDHQLPVDVIGVMAAEGEGCYAEVLVDLPSREERVSIGLQRDAEILELTRQIETHLGIGHGNT
jgi:hypothetical protein